MKIALILGVSEYQNISPLPGCKNDYLAISTLLKETEEFDEITSICDESSSVVFKEKITLFFKKHRGEEIEELFFYYTGHGDFYSDDFYYILSDFSDNKLKQTAIQNNEIDNLIKSLNPKLVVKVVDACKSGVSYIKDRSVVDDFIRKSSEKFEYCYFLHSSLNNQFSYQSDKISYFTQSFLRAIASYEGGRIRYKHIIDHISDFFREVEEQTPYFVVQAELTEVFCDITPVIRRTISKYLETYIIEDNEEQLSEESYDEPRPSTLLKRVDQTSKVYKSEEEVSRLLLDIKESFEHYELVDEIKEIYRLEKKYPTYLSSKVGLDKVGEELLNHLTEDYFFDLEYEDEEYETEGRGGVFMQPRMVTRTRRVISGYELTAKYPYNQIIIELESNYRPLHDFHFRLCFVTSERDIRFFTSIVQYSKVGFDEKKVGGFVEWETKKFMLIEEEEICNYIIEVMDGINSFLIEYINSQV